MDIPGIPRLPTEPLVAHRQRSESQLGDEDCARFVQALNDSSVIINMLLLEAACPPRSAIALHCEQVLCAPRQAVKWTAILSRGNLAIGFLRLCAGSIFGQSDDELQHGIVLLEPPKIHVGECN